VEDSLEKPAQSLWMLRNRGLEPAYLPDDNIENIKKTISKIMEPTIIDSKVSFKT